MMTIDWDEMVDTSARLLHEAKVLDALLGEAHAGSTAPLPAPALTEQAIVDALKADPAMAGRVIGELVKTLGDNQRTVLANAARDSVAADDMSFSFYRALQSLAVALAAASYRG